MVLKNSLTLINEFYFYISNKIRKLYLNSSIYNNKISKIDNGVLSYKPSHSILNCIVKYEKKKNKIEDFSLNSICLLSVSSSSVKISISKLIQNPDHKKKTASIVIITHEAKELNSKKCLKSFRANKYILKTPVLIRLF